MPTDPHDEFVILSDQLSAPPTAPKLSPFALVTADQLSPDVSEVYSVLLDSHAETLTGILESLHLDTELIRASPTLNSRGISEQLRNRAEKAYSEIERAGKHRKKSLARDLEEAIAGMPTIPAPRAGDSAEALHFYLRGKEIRDALPKDPILLQADLRQAAIRGDTEVLQAVLFAPTPIKEQINKALKFDDLVKVWAQAHRPEAYSRRSIVERANATFSANQGTAMKAVEKLSGIPAPLPPPELSPLEFDRFE